LRQDEALARAVSNAETAERLLAVDDDPGPYGAYEEARTSRQAGAAAYAAVASAWAAIAAQLPSGSDEQVREANDRRRESSDRRAQA
jgi:hypothetical protein